MTKYHHDNSPLAIRYSPNHWFFFSGSTFILRNIEGSGKNMCVRLKVNFMIKLVVSHKRRRQSATNGMIAINPLHGEYMALGVPDILDLPGHPKHIRVRRP